MVSETDIYRSAIQVINKCGRRFNPKEYSFSRMCAMHNRGNIDQAIFWANVANAVEEMLNKNPKRSTYVTVRDSKT